MVEEMKLADIQIEFFNLLSEIQREEFNKLENAIFETLMVEKLELINYVIEFLKQINYFN